MGLCCAEEQAGVEWTFGPEGSISADEAKQGANLEGSYLLDFRLIS